MLFWALLASGQITLRRVDGWDTLHLGFWAVDALADDLVSYGADVVVESPPAVREAVIARLRSLAGAA